MSDSSQLKNSTSVKGVEIRGPHLPATNQILTQEAQEFLAALARKFESTRRELLKSREKRQREIDQGKMPQFLETTKKIRESDWRVASIPKDLEKRKLEITGPCERKMIINALNSGADVFMADFEDSNSPTWQNNIEGHINLIDAVRRTITFTNLEGKQYELNKKTAVLVLRPRGWHLVEKHFYVDGEPISASLFDFALYFFHNAKELLQRGTGPYFYLPKMESHMEARLWNDVFNFSQDRLNVPRGTIRATVLIETILAAFEMDEILYELREHSSGLNCGRWDYIFSFIKRFRANKKFVMPDRSQITMDKHFLNSYVELLIQTCHKRGIHAMGGMAAQIPIKSDAKANDAALEKVRQDKLREVKAGHDGTWVAHPGLVPVAGEIFEKGFQGANQLERMREDVKVTAEDLLTVPKGTITEKGLRTNINVGILYLESWLKGQGCVPLYHLMEDSATAEISRSQVWQWIHHQAKLTEGAMVTKRLVEKVIQEELKKIEEAVGSEKFQAGQFKKAAEIFHQMMTAPNFPEFLTLEAYELLD